MSSKPGGETKRSSVRSVLRQKFSRKSSKKKKDDQPKDDVGRRLAMANAPAADFTPGSNVFRADAVDSGRFGGKGNLSDSVASLDDLTGDVARAAAAATAVVSKNDDAATIKTNGKEAQTQAAAPPPPPPPVASRDAKGSREETAMEIKAITKQIVALRRQSVDEGDDDEDEDEDSSSDSGPDDERKESEVRFPLHRKGDGARGRKNIRNIFGSII